MDKDPEIKEKILSYFKHLREFTEIITEDMLKSLGIESITMINEVETTDPMIPVIIIKNMDGSKETIRGYVEIPEYLNKLMAKIESNGNFIDSEIK